MLELQLHLTTPSSEASQIHSLQQRSKQTPRATKTSYHANDDNIWPGANKPEGVLLVTLQPMLPGHGPSLRDDIVCSHQ